MPDNREDGIFLWVSKGVKGALPDYKTAIAGGVAGSVGKTLTAPLSRMTILYQVKPDLAKFSLPAAYSHVLRNEGLLAFWKGNLTSVVHRFPYSAINFTVYDNMRKLLCSKQPGGYGLDESVGVRLFCGATSGAAACCSCYPLEIARTRLAAYTGKGKVSVLGLIRQVIVEEGLFRGLFRGLGMSVAVAVPNIALSFTVYGSIKDCFLTSGIIPTEFLCDCKTGKFTLFGGLISGSISAVLSSLLTFPADTIRKRLQSSKDAVKDGIIKEVKSIVKLNGSVLGLYKGIAPELLRVMPMAGITFGTYEMVMNILDEATGTTSDRR